MDASGTCVCVRMRPPNSRESGQRCLSRASSTAVAFKRTGGGGGGGDGGSGSGSNTFQFNKVYGESTTQRDVFDDCRCVVSSVLAGYNGTIMAYGQTGSGKTHTLIGDVSDPDQRGIVPRAVEALGEGIAADDSGAEYEVRLTVVEIYCERIRDLLDPLGRDNLPIKQGLDGGTFVEGVTEVCVTDEEQLVGIMEAGLAQRAVKATAMNAASSRSHCIVTVAVEKACPDGSTVSGKLRMVDLAGSERQDKTGAAGQTLVEGSLINRSLSALANVVAALTDGGGGHVSYRDSKLTRMLQDSLGGSARTVLIINCSPCADNGPETLSSLRFGSRALGIKNRVAVNRRLNPEALQRQLTEARAQIEELQRQVAALQAGAGAAAVTASAGAATVAGGAPGAADGEGQLAGREPAAPGAGCGACGSAGGGGSGGGSRGGGGARSWAESLACGVAVGASMLVYMGLEDWLAGRLAGVVL